MLLLALLLLLELFDSLPALPGLGVLGCLFDLLKAGGNPVCGGLLGGVMLDDRTVGAAVVTILMLISGDAEGLRVGDLEGTSVGSFVRGEMVGEPSGRAGQKAGQALAVSD